MEINEKNVIMYLRKSRADDSAQQVCEVLAKHELQLQDYAVREFGKKISEEHICREVVSGETIDDRPVMKKVLHMLESQIYAGVLVIEPQRLSRGDLLDCGRVINTFRYTNTAVITPTKIYNLCDEYDRRFFEMELMRGNDYLEYSKRIMNRGRMASVKQGNYIASVRPFGYNKIIAGSGKDKFHTLEIKQEEANVVKMIFDLYVNKGYGFAKIAKILDSGSVKPLKSDNWSPYSINSILSNPVYIGKIRWNIRKTVKIWKDEKILKTRPFNHNNDEIIMADGKHEAIIDEKIFYEAQKKRGSISREKKDVTLKNPFAGIMVCGRCGAAMIMKKYTDKRNKNNKDATYILCSRQSVCHTKSVKYSKISEIIKDSLLCILPEFEIDMSVCRQKENCIDVAIDSILNNIHLMKKKDERQKDAYENGIYSKEEYKLRNEELQSQIKKAEEMVENERERQKELLLYKEKKLYFNDCIKLIDNQNIDAAKMNHFLKSFISKIEYYDNSFNDMNKYNLKIYLKI